MVVRRTKRGQRQQLDIASNKSSGSRDRASIEADLEAPGYVGAELPGELVGRRSDLGCGSRRAGCCRQSGELGPRAAQKVSRRALQTKRRLGPSKPRAFWVWLPEKQPLCVEHRRDTLVQKLRRIGCGCPCIAIDFSTARAAVSRSFSVAAAITATCIAALSAQPFADVSSSA